MQPTTNYASKNNRQPIAVAKIWLVLSTATKIRLINNPKCTKRVAQAITISKASATRASSRNWPRSSGRLKRPTKNWKGKMRSTRSFTKIWSKTIAALRLRQTSPIWKWSHNKARSWSESLIHQSTWLSRRTNSKAIAATLLTLDQPPCKARFEKATSLMNSTLKAKAARHRLKSALLKSLNILKNQKMRKRTRRLLTSF